MKVVVALTLVCVGAVVLAGGESSTQSPVVYPPQRLPIVFSHATHLARGTPCEACHAAARTSRSAVDNLIPTEAECRACHAIDRTQPTKVATPVAACTACHPGYTPGATVARTLVM